MKKNRIVIGVSPDQIRFMCQNLRYCTQCNDQQYSKLLAFCTNDVNAARIRTICDNIFRYTAVAAICAEYNCTPDELYRDIVCNVLNRCTYLNLITV